MQPALDAFRSGLARVREMHATHEVLSKMTTPAVDLSDMLRAEIVLAVSAFDHFIHEMARLGMLEIFSGARPRTDAFSRFNVSLTCAMAISVAVFDTEIRNRHSFLSFQHPDKVADAIRLFSPVELWNTVAASMGSEPRKLKSDFLLVVDRRNKIAHEGDNDPSYPGQKWPIDRGQVEHAINLVSAVGEAIFNAAA